MAAADLDITSVSQGKDRMGERKQCGSQESRSFSQNLSEVSCGYS